MQEEVRDNIQNFYVVGISYRKSSVQIREKFSLSTDVQAKMLQDSKHFGIDSLIVLSTCNRTELYVYAKEQDKALTFFLQYTQGTLSDFEDFGYILNAHEAVLHVFRVSNGIDSQILGDVQIINQMKSAFRMSKESGVLNTFMERLFQHIARASKQIKNRTDLSAGAASVASAAVQSLMSNSTDLHAEHVLLYGLGEIGCTTCQNLIKHVTPQNIVVINRTASKAEDFARLYGVAWAPESDLISHISSSTALIVATGADQPTITANMLRDFAGIVFDLSVPRNVEAACAQSDKLRLITIDDLAELNDEVRQLRESSVPEAEAIINDIINEFYGWLELKYLSPVFFELRNALHKIKDTEVAYHHAEFDEQSLAVVDHLTTNIVDRVADLCIAHLKDYHKEKMSPTETIEAIFKLKQQ